MIPTIPSLRWSGVFAVVALSLSLGACQKTPAANADGSPAADVASSDADASAADVPNAEAPPLDLGDFRIVSVLLGKSLDADRIVVGDANTFGPKDKIHASVLSTGAHAGLRLSAKWLAPDGSLVAETEQPLVPTAATAITFSIQNPTGWPEGEYQLQVAVNGSTLQVRKFQVH